MRRRGFTVLKALFVILLMLVFQPLPASSADGAPPAEVVSAAEKGMTVFVKGAEGKSLRLLGLSSAEKAQAAGLGQGFQVYAASPDGLLAGKASRTLDSIAEATNLWQFLVLTDGKAASLLTVDFFKGAWTPVSIGSAGLAAEMVALLNKWPASSGYGYKLIRVYQAKSDFMAIFQGANLVGIIPFTSARIAMGLEDTAFDPLDLHDSAGALVKLTPAVKTGLGR
jgi:hypothetical protein